MTTATQFVRQLFDLRRYPARLGLRHDAQKFWQFLRQFLQCARNQCCLAREFTHFNALLVNTERYTPFPLKIQDKQNIAADQLTN